MRDRGSIGGEVSGFMAARPPGGGAARAPGAGVRRPLVEPIYAVVRFEGTASRGVAEVVVAFESAQAADRFAAECGHDDYAVAPIGFHVDPVEV